MCEYFCNYVRMGSEIHEQRVSIDRGFPGEVVRRGSAVLVNNPQNSTFFDHEVDIPEDGSCRNAAAMPIFSKDDPSRIGAVLVIYNALKKTENGLGDRDFADEAADAFGGLKRCGRQED